MSDFNELHMHGMKLKFFYSVIGLIIGLCCIISGTILGLSGVVGHTTFAASIIGLNTQLTDAAPGVIVFVVGIFIVWITKFKVDHRFEEPPELNEPDSKKGRRRSTIHYHQ